VILHTVRPAMLTTSVYCSPSTVDPSPKASENVLERSCAVELALGSYRLCPEQFDPHISEGKKRSLLPVSKSTVSCRGSESDFKSSYTKGHTSKSHGWCANRDVSKPQLSIVIGQRVTASVTFGELDASRKWVWYASIPLVCGKSTLNFPVSDG